MIEIIEEAEVPSAVVAALGRVAAPPRYESTSGVFYFWVDRACTIERTQIVTTRSTIANREVKFIGIVQEVFRQSRQKDVHEEAARFDGRTSERPPFDSEGVTFAQVAILRTEPVAHTPPTEESEVMLASSLEAGKGYGLDKMGERLDIGLLRNGGTAFAGRAAIDLDFLLGKNGGHLNVNGIAGLGTKSTLLLTLNSLLLHEAARQKRDNVSGERLQVVPVIFNVKNFDLFFIDRWNKEFRKKEADNRKDWKDTGVPDPAPFAKPKFYAPQARNVITPVPTGGRTLDVQPYSWSLSDIIEQGLFKYLFSEDDISTANLGGLVNEVEEYLTHGTSDQPKLRTTDAAPQTFDEMIEWFKQIRNKEIDLFGDFGSGTKGSFLRRLKYVVMEGDGVLRRKNPKGSPLVIPSSGVESPIVIDLFGISRTQSLQRFVVAAVFHQIMHHQTAKQVKGLKYLVTLDELNRFAPKDSSDEITAMIETVASEGRSQGVILLGAQQQASLVKPRVIENAAVRAIGRSGTLELGQEVWKFLSKSAKDAAVQLQPEEKLLYQPSFREPMLAKIPFPPFALSETDAEAPTGIHAAASPRDTADQDAF